MMTKARLEEMKRLATEKGTAFATESSLVSDQLRIALTDAVAEIEELQKKVDTERKRGDQFFRESCRADEAIAKLTGEE
jgi:hypothetical protein